MTEPALSGLSIALLCFCSVGLLYYLLFCYKLGMMAYWQIRGPHR